MRVTVEVKPQCKKPGIEALADGTLRVRVRAPPVDGKANEAVIEALAEYFGVRRSAVTLLMGESSRKKIFEIDP